MKSIDVILEITIDEDVYQQYLDVGYLPDQIKNYIESAIESAKIESGLIMDFTVERMTEVKE